MAGTVNALYNSRPEAEVARARLASEAGVSGIRILGRTSAGELAKLTLSDEDRRRYSDGIARGAVLLTAELRGKEDEARIIRILEEAARGGAPAGESGPPGVIAEERIPMVEEELRIGKREVARGGARVRSHVREVPAEADVTLKQERLDADIRPVERRMEDADVQAAGLLKPRVVELSEMREVPVVTKEAFVREEVVVRKTVEERVETIRDTVRRTEVDVEDLDPRGPGSYGADAGRRY
jgi:hypothetical protein